MGTVSTNEFKGGMKLEIDGDPYTIVGVEFVKPGKGQAFVRTKIKHLLSGRVIEKTYKSGEKFELADVEETKLRMLYIEGDNAVFMNDHDFNQVEVSLPTLGMRPDFLLDDMLYDVIFYKGNIVDIIPPTFLNLKVAETAPGVRGDTASGRVMKPAKLETGLEIQVPIFIEEGELIKVDTRESAYVSRVNE